MLKKIVKINYEIEGTPRHITGTIKEENEHYIIVIGNLNGKEYRISHSAIKLMKVVEWLGI